MLGTQGTLLLKLVKISFNAKQDLLLSATVGQSSRSEGVFDDKFSYFSSKPYVVNPHLNSLVEMVQMRGHNILFFCRINKNYP